MPLLSAKVIMGVKLVASISPAVAYLWHRAHVGWRYDFADLPEEVIENRGARVKVRHLRTATGWPVHTMLRYTLADRWLFELSAQGRFHLEDEVALGHPPVDDRFFIPAESERFAKALLTSAELRRHLLGLDQILTRHAARFGRLGCDGRDVAIKCNVRWTVDRPRLYAELATWLASFDEMLQAVHRRPPAQVAQP